MITLTVRVLLCLAGMYTLGVDPAAPADNVVGALCIALAAVLKFSYQGKRV